MIHEWVKFFGGIAPIQFCGNCCPHKDQRVLVMISIYVNLTLRNALQ